MRKININLLPKKKSGFSDVVTYFLLHYLRYIIVITQIVVIGIFFYRFKIDQEIVDLKETIEQKEEIFKVTLPLVEEAQIINTRIAEIKKFFDEQNKFTGNLNYLSSIIPQKIVLNKLEINETEARLSGTAFEVLQIKLLRDKLINDNKFKRTSLDQVTRSDFGFDFSMFIIL